MHDRRSAVSNLTEGSSTKWFTGFSASDLSYMQHSNYHSKDLAITKYTVKMAFFSEIQALASILASDTVNTSLVVFGLDSVPS